MNKRNKNLILFGLIFALMIGCSLVPQKKNSALVLENDTRIKELEKKTGTSANPELENNVGYCPICEL